MPKIQAEAANGLVETEPPAGKNLVLALEDAGIDILHRCGGNARFTPCRVEVLEGEPGEMRELERNRLAMESELGPNIRLSCRHERRMFGPSSDSIASRLRSSSLISPGSPSRTSTRQGVKRALPPQRCRISMPASSSASTRFFPAGVSVSTRPFAVSA